MLLAAQVLSLGELDGNLNLGPLVPSVRGVVAEESRLASSDPLVLRSQRLSESVDSEVEKAVGETALLSDGDIGGLSSVLHPDVTASVASGALTRALVEEAHDPADLEVAEELSRVVSVSEVELDGSSHRDVSALDVVEKGPESTANSHNSLENKVLAIVRGSSVGRVGLNVDSILGGRG